MQYLAAYLGITLQGQRKFKEAAKHYEIALQLDPSNTQASEQLDFIRKTHLKSH